MDDYAKIQKQVQDEIKNYLSNYAIQNQFRLSKIPTHVHDGNDVAKISPINLLGFRVDTVADGAVAPTDKVLIGTMRFQVDNKSGTAHWFLWAFLPNVKTGIQGWHYVALT